MGNSMMSVHLFSLKRNESLKYLRYNITVNFPVYSILFLLIMNNVVSTIMGLHSDSAVYAAMDKSIVNSAGDFEYF